MKILGLTLQHPDKTSLAAALIAGGLIAAVLVVLTAVGSLPPMGAALLAASGMGGALASAYGASISKNGWRGALVSTACSALLMAMVYGLWMLA